MKRFTMTTILVLALVASLAGATERIHTIEAEDYFSIAGITGIALSPDGTTAAWTEMRWDEEDDGRNTELWTINLESKEPQRLTFDGMGPSGIRFGRDGRWIYFSASDADGDSQIWRIATAGGDAKKMTSVSDGIDLCDLSADEHTLVYTISADQTDDEWKSLMFAWTVCKHVKSNAIVVAKGERAVGIGAGQMARVDSVTIAVESAGKKAKNAVLASDGFFPFPDSVERAADAGISAIIQPGGSIKDKEVVKAADDHGIAMVISGQRTFLH